MAEVKRATPNTAPELPEGYRMTELGPLPDEWKATRLGEIISFPSKPRDWEPTPKLAFIPMEAIPNDGRLAPYYFKYQASIKSGVYCEGGSILLAKITPSLENGKQCIVPSHLRCAFATTEVFVLKPSSKIDAYFLFAILRSPWVRKYFAEKMEGSTGRQRLPKHVLINFKIPLPPLPEQRAIAHVLRTVQEAKEATEKVIAAARELKKSLMRHLFTYGPVPVDQADQVPLKETEIGLVPEHWEVVKLEKCLRERLRNGFSARESTSDQGIRTFTLSAVTQNRFTVENTKITVADPRKVQDLWAEPGDIFIERANTSELVGLAALYEGPKNFAIFPDLLVRIRVNEEKIFSKFLVEFLLTPKARNYFRKNARKTAGNMPKIDHGTIKSLSIPLPPLPEQKQITHILRTIDAKIEAEENRKEALEALFKSLLHDLMTARRRLPKDFVARFAEGKSA